MPDISVAEAKSHFSDLLKRASEGEEIIITRRGKPFAMLTRAVVNQKLPRLGSMAGTAVLTPGWEAPLTDEEFEEFTNHGDL